MPGMTPATSPTCRTAVHGWPRSTSLSSTCRARTGKLLGASPAGVAGGTVAWFRAACPLGSPDPTATLPLLLFRLTALSVQLARCPGVPSHRIGGPLSRRCQTTESVMASFLRRPAFAWVIAILTMVAGLIAPTRIPYRPVSGRCRPP
ncbi:hypothetical protein ACU4GD_29575 [Cupriavidus basilensis]